MPSLRTYQVKEVAELSGLSVRALHHYDEIGLLTPTGRSAAGYRLYNDDDLLRLQQIVIGRELGLSLEAIRQSLDDPRFDRREALREQRAELERRATSTADMIGAIDAAIEALNERDAEVPMDRERKVDFKKIFNGFDPDKHTEEVERRWGNTQGYKAAKKRWATYTEADWVKCRDEQSAIYADAFAALEAGKSPEDATAMDIAERHRLSFDRWYYPCSVQMHCTLADMWEADRRYGDSIDKHGGPGLTKFLAAAVRANAQRAGER